MSSDRPHEHDPEAVSRRGFLRAGLVAGAAAVAARSEAQPQVRPGGDVEAFELDEVGLADLQAGLAAGKWTSVGLVEKYLARIAAIDHAGLSLRSVIEVNPDAVALAAALDKERKEKGPRGPLHGIPVLLKDNIDTADKMASTSGSLALVDAAPPDADAFLVAKLRAAGAVLLGKTNLSEWAEMRSSYCTGGWSGRGGLTRNPYALDRNAAGSSSGSAVAVAASLCAVAVGTETSSSIVRPASVNGIVGIKPTVGLVSRAGIIPLALSQDTAGPMARTVADAAALLSVLTANDPNDPDRDRPPGRPPRPVNYADHLKADGLKDKRVGVVREFCGIHDAVEALLRDAIKALEKEGATVVDVNLPKGLDTQTQWFGDELTILYHEFKVDLNAYLKARKPRPGLKIPRSLAELIRFNEEHKERELAHFGQDLLIDAEATAGLGAMKYRDAVTAVRPTARKGIDKVMGDGKLAALIAPTEGPAWVTDLVCGDHFRTKSTSAAAIAGYPSMTVPMGQVSGLPVGLSFFGRAWSEAILIEVAYAFEQATNHRRKPRFPARAG